jgi:A/G-specific adenine glycosylase
MRVRVVSSETQAAILAWYDDRGRALPFRGQRDPYAILLSEVMAQQTQISRVSEQWASFMTTFPTIERLAEAPTADVLRAWRGLGYNRRALHLQRAARVIVSDHGGAVPSSIDELLKLPGVGPYTSRAVAALAFGRAVGPVDTNVRRVLSRLVSARGAVSVRALQSIADRSVPRARPAEWTHALMDLGATVCSPNTPRCSDCPAAPWCRSATRVQRRVRRGHSPAGAGFGSTSRWLRGRILDQLRDVPDDEWGAVVAPIGQHDGQAVDAALLTMESEGLIERDRSDTGRARLAR